MPWLQRLGQVLSSASKSSLSSSLYNGARTLSTSAASQAGAEDPFAWVSPYPSWWSHQKPESETYCRQRQIIALGNRVPAIAACAYVAPSAVVVGDVDIMDGASIWHGSVVRGDLNNIRIGAFSSIQENCVLHAARSSPTGLSAATRIGVSVTVGAGSMLRSCTIEDLVIIGERCIVMEGSVVKSHAVLQPGTVVPPAKLIPGGQLWGGCPAQFIRNLTHDEEGEIGHVADGTEKYKSLHAAEEIPIGTLWKKSEAVDPSDERINPDTKEVPEWVFRTRA